MVLDCSVAEPYMLVIFIALKNPFHFNVCGLFVVTVLLQC